MNRDFHPINPAVWSSPGFLSLDGDSRQLHLYFLCGPHQTNAGCCRVREGYVMADLGWSAEQYRQALANVVGANLVLHDPATSETYVLRWFQHKGNIPTNKDHARGIMKTISFVDSDDIRLAAEADFLDTEWGRKVSPAANDETAAEPINPVVQPITAALMNSRMMKGG